MYEHKQQKEVLLINKPGQIASSGAIQIQQTTVFDGKAIPCEDVRSAQEKGLYERYITLVGEKQCQTQKTSDTHYSSSQVEVSMHGHRHKNKIALPKACTLSQYRQHSHCQVIMDFLCYKQNVSHYHYQQSCLNHKQIAIPSLSLPVFARRSTHCVSTN